MNQSKANGQPRSGGYNVATPDRLLDAAERLFARRHYDSVTLKEIADEAAANVGQIVYHFGRKDMLLRKIILRRAEVLNTDRVHLLKNYEQLVGSDNVEVLPLVRAFLDPYFRRLLQDNPQWRSFARFIGRAVWDGKLADYMSESFDDAAHLYLDAFQRAIPSLTRNDAVRGFQFMLATMHVSAIDDSRVNALLHASPANSDFEAYYEVLVPYIAGGFLAVGEHRLTNNSKDAPA